MNLPTNRSGVVFVMVLLASMQITSVLANLGQNSAVAGGDSNTASGDNSFVGAGTNNVASGDYASIGAGKSNAASGEYDFVGAGKENNASGVQAFIGAGEGNSAGGDRAFVGGGLDNAVTAYGSGGFVGGGSYNKVTGYASYGFVGAGTLNVVSGYGAFVGAGFENKASGDKAFVGAGYGNKASGSNAFVGAGQSNLASGEDSVSLGDRAKATHSHSLVLGFDDVSDEDCGSQGDGSVTICTGTGGFWLNNAKLNVTSMLTKLAALEARIATLEGRRDEANTLDQEYGASSDLTATTSFPLMLCLPAGMFMSLLFLDK